MATTHDFKHIASYTLIDRTSVVSELHFDASGNAQARCPICGKELKLHDEDWLVPSTMVGKDGAETPAQFLELLRKRTQGNSNYTVALRNHHVEYMLDDVLSMNAYSLLYVNDPKASKLFRAIDVKIWPLPNDLPNQARYIGLCRCDSCGALLRPLDYSSHLTVELASVDISYNNKLIKIRIRYSPQIDSRLSDKVDLSCVFDKERGLFEFDGTQQLGSFLNAGCTIPRALGNIHVHECIRKLLPSGIVCPSWEARKDNALSLVFHNRFRNYPSTFFDACESCFGMSFYGGRFIVGSQGYGTENLFKSCCELPLNYDGMENCYLLSNLPDTKAIKRLAYQNPLIIAARRCIQEPVFENTDVLQSLLADPQGPALLVNMRARGISDEWYWKRLAEQKGEDWTCRVARKLGASNVVDIQGWHFDNESFVSTCREPVSLELARELRRFYYELTLGQELDEAYPYTEEHLRYEWEGDNYSFQLPKTPRQLMDAGATLHNCLEHWKLSLDSSLIVLVHSGDEGKVCAAIELDLARNRIKQAHTACNQAIPQEGALAEAFNLWCTTMELANNVRGQQVDDLENV